MGKNGAPAFSDSSSEYMRRAGILEGDPQFYLPLMGDTLDTIEIKLKSQNDELYPLERNSHTVARIHFRLRRMPLQSI